jgi:hypothetical protein
MQVKFLDYYHDEPYEWQDFHECVHFLLAVRATLTVLINNSSLKI